MESIFFAKLIGLYLTIVSIGMLANKKRIQPILGELAANKPLMLLSGTLSLLFGLVIIIAHNIWSGWPIIITLIGWLALLKGITRLYFTEKCIKYARYFFENKTYLYTSIVILVIGLILLYCGFVLH